MKLTFDEDAWDDYQRWIAQDCKILKRITDLIKDIARNGNEGIGRPEQIRHMDFWSRRITDEHRLVYRIEGDTILVAQCRYHYER